LYKKQDRDSDGERKVHSLSDQSSIAVRRGSRNQIHVARCRSSGSSSSPPQKPAHRYSRVSITLDPRLSSTYLSLSIPPNLRLTVARRCSQIERQANPRAAGLSGFPLTSCTLPNSPSWPPERSRRTSTALPRVTGIAARDTVTIEVPERAPVLGGIGPGVRGGTDTTTVSELSEVSGRSFLVTRIPSVSCPATSPLSSLNHQLCLWVASC
jgi:hypothetical protein